MSRRKKEDGAAAVEFALLVTIFVTLLFGIVDYGLFFSDSISTRQGVREAARQGVVSSWSTDASCTGDSLDRVRCQTKSNIGALYGDATAKVYVPGGTWTKGARLVVCAKVVGSGAVGLVPMPDDTRSKVEMSIETESVPPTGGFSSADAGDWSWC